MWEKLVHLSTAAAMTCLMQANDDPLINVRNNSYAISFSRRQ
jgi:hypothetical protein